MSRATFSSLFPTNVAGDENKASSENNFLSKVVTKYFLAKIVVKVWIQNSKITDVLIEVNLGEN